MDIFERGMTGFSGGLYVCVEDCKECHCIAAFPPPPAAVEAEEFPPGTVSSLSMNGGATGRDLPKRHGMGVKQGVPLDSSSLKPGNE
jgi:hypothetical protein